MAGAGRVLHRLLGIKDTTRYGNTSAAAVAVALDEANRSGRIKRGDYVLMVVFGGGLTWASTILE
jgi:3-oxoacyl-[acyl-carrier-protein] synthase-3